MVSAGLSTLFSTEHSLLVFLQQVVFFCSAGVLPKSNTLAINAAVIIARLILYFFCMVVVLEFDESRKRNVTGFLLFNWRPLFFGE